MLAHAPGPVDLEAPRHRVALLEDCTRGRRDDAATRAAAARAGAARVFVARRLAEGAGALLVEYALPTRRCVRGRAPRAVGDEAEAFIPLPPRYVGRTALPPAPAFLLTNAARVDARSRRVLDPFCGSCSTLLAAARFGARETVGVDADERALPRGAIAATFRDHALRPPRLALADAARLACLHGGGVRFDAIVTDPPYGVMEGLGARFVPTSERVRTLARIAAARLRVGGRLVFLMPFERENGALPELPLELPRCLELESLSHEPISKRLGRALVAMVKTREPDSAGIDT